MNALEPVSCSRCGVVVAADDPTRPESVTGRVFAPMNPRPQVPGCSDVWWTVEGDYRDGGRVAALLCAPCVAALVEWVYGGPAAPGS